MDSLRRSSSERGDREGGKSRGENVNAENVGVGTAPSPGPLGFGEEGRDGTGVLSQLSWWHWAHDQRKEGICISKMYLSRRQSNRE